MGTRASRMRPIPLAACWAATTTQYLALRAAPTLFARFRSADENLVDFDNALQPLTTGTNHRPTQFVQQCPRRAVAPQPQHPLQAQSAGPTFLAGHVPERFEPHAQGQMSVREQTFPPSLTSVGRTDGSGASLAPSPNDPPCRISDSGSLPATAGARHSLKTRRVVDEPIAKLQHRAGILSHRRTTTAWAT